MQARRRKQPTLPPASDRPIRVEHEYFREGAWTYWAAWDVHRAKVFGRCEHKTGIAPVDRLVREVMSQEPYKSAHRVFWIMDNCSAHRGQKAMDRLKSQWPNAILVHTPIHASWLNQVEIYFSIVQRKVLTPNDFSSLAELEQRLLAFQSHYEKTASPFQWTFTSRTSPRACTHIKTNALRHRSWSCSLLLFLGQKQTVSFLWFFSCRVLACDYADMWISRSTFRGRRSRASDHWPS